MSGSSARSEGSAGADRDLVLDWADNNVRGVFEVRAARPAGAGPAGAGPAGAGPAGAVSALNLVDDLEYLVYGLAAGAAEPGGFFAATLLPLADDDSAWLAAGDYIGYPRADARQVARLAIDLATREPDLVSATRRRPPRAGRTCGATGRSSWRSSAPTSPCCPSWRPRAGSTPTTRCADSALAARGRHRVVSEPARPPS